jgi:hypothetical protein
MIKMNKFFKTSMLTMLIVSFLTVAVYGQEPGFYPVAEPRFSSSEIVWVPLVNYNFLDLTIARPDGTLFSRTFDAGSTPYADLSDILGKGNLDGSYIYELRATMEREQKHRKDDEVEIRYSTAPLVQTGAFSVLNRTIMNPEEQEPDSDKGKGLSFSSVQDGLSRTQDFVINDDLIVIGSACIGFDCVNGESFGFDTLRFKENNLRIKFDDTSTLAGFPNVDWQLTANDSANGGVSKFSIDDITNARTPFTVEAGARNNSLYVDDGGRIGIRTSTPALEIHVVDGDTPALRLQQDSSSGFAPQTWDIAGNEANFFVRDATNGSKLPFRIQPSTPSSTLCLKSDGKVGIGTWSPGYKFEIETTNEDAMLYLDRTDGAQFKLNVTTAQGQIGTQSSHKLNIVTANANRITINSNGNVGINNTNPGQLFVVGAAGTTYCDGNDWYPTSTREAKENIIGLTEDEALQALNGLTPVKYNYKQNKEEERVGFIAEDVPELVAINGRKNLNSMDIVAVLTKVVQEQQKTISELKREIAALKKK